MWLGCGSSKSVKSSPGVAKAQPLYLGAKLNLGDRVWGEVEKNSFIALPGKGGTMGSCPQNGVSQPGRI